MDHNVIQRPELLRLLQQRLGLQQAHVAPTLAEHVQPVVILEDFGRSPANIGLRFGVWTSMQAGAANPAAAWYIRPNAGVIGRLHRIVFHSALASGLWNIAFQNTPTGPVMNTFTGDRSGVCLAQGDLLPPDVLARSTGLAQCRVAGGDKNPGAVTFWEGHYFSADPPTGQVLPYEIKFDHLYLAPYKVGFNTLWFWVEDTAGQGEAYFEWEEIPRS